MGSRDGYVIVLKSTAECYIDLFLIQHNKCVLPKFAQLVA